MTASTISRGVIGRRATLLLLGAIVALSGMFALGAGQAKAVPFSMNLNSAQLNLGFAFQGAQILPAPNRTSGANLTPTLPDLWVARNQTVPAQGACLINIGGPGPGGSCGPNPAVATISGDVTDGVITIPENLFQFPIMVVTSPIDGSPVPVTIASTGTVTGTTTTTDGKATLELSGPIEARVLVGLSPQSANPDANPPVIALPADPLGRYCALPLGSPFVLSTTSNNTFPGVPFGGGIGGAGALTGSFNIVDDSTAVGPEGTNCGSVNAATKGIGAIWVANSIQVPPVCGEFEQGIVPNCLPIPCPAGFIGDEPDCVELKSRIGNLTVNGPSNIRKGKKVTYKVTIRNTGNAQATQVRLRASGRGISVNTPVAPINAGANRTVNLNIRPARTGKVKATFKVTFKDAGSRSVTRTITVR